MLMNIAIILLLISNGLSFLTIMNLKKKLKNKA